MMPFSEIILASASPRRSYLLETMGLRFRTQPAEVEELDNEVDCPETLVLHNAKLKATWVAEREPNGLILGSDTTVALKDEILNKPADLEEAASMLRRLSGNIHTVYTAVCLIAPAISLFENHVVSSQVTFKTLNDRVIEEYFSIVNPSRQSGVLRHPRRQGTHSRRFGWLLKQCYGTPHRIFRNPPQRDRVD